MDKNNIKILCLNKKDADLKHRIDHINFLLDKHKPHFLGLNELQKHKHDTVSPYQFPGYRLEFDNLDKTDGWSRTGILVKNNIKYKRRRDLESEGTSTVWLQVGCTGRKHFLLQCLYRQFQRPGRIASKSQQSQNNRWDTILEKWSLASNEDREIISIGDFNMDSISWDKPWNETPEYEKHKQTFYNKLKEKILMTGTFKLNTEHTRVDHQPGGRATCLDHIYTTNPERISSHHTHQSTFSDHALLELNKKCKKFQNTKNFIKIRSMKNFDRTQYKENLKEHPLFIETLYTKDPDTIAQNITQMIQESLAEMSPVIRIQMSSKNQNPISQTARDAITERDNAHKTAKLTPTIENQRQYRHLRNTANRIIAKERFDRRKAKFQMDGVSDRDKWNLVKSDTGQKLITSPDIIIEGDRYHTKPQEIANSLNRMYISSVRSTINNIPETEINPLKHYKEYLGPVDSKLNLQTVSMSQLRTIIKSMKSTSSTTSDYVSMRVIKEAGTVLQPHLLNLVNSVITSEKYPQQLKITKIVPIPKANKDPTSQAGWRPINVVPALSKVIEKCMLSQVLKYLKTNNFINHSHHGSVQYKNTQTIVQELYEMLLFSLEKGETAAFIQLDQSKAYDVISHHILLQKMKALGFNKKTINIFTSYLGDRKQYVSVDSFSSDTLLVGPQSVTQGSTLSCVMYLIFILDITQIHHAVRHDPNEYRICSGQSSQKYSQCKQTNAKTYVDGNLMRTIPKPNQSLQEAVLQTLERIETYTNANKLALNPEKSRIMIISKDNVLKNEFQVTIGGKVLRHQKKLMVLGNLFTEDLTWDLHVNTVVIPALTNRARTLKQTASIMEHKFRKCYSTAIFMGKMSFAIDAWSGVKQSSLTKLQKLQDRVAKSTMGYKGAKMSSSQRLRALGWLPVSQEALLATHRITHKILHRGVPEELASMMPPNTTNLRLLEAKKLATKPKYLNKNKRTTASYRNRAYCFNTLPNRLTSLKDHKQFGKWLKVYLRDPSKLPKVIPDKPSPNQVPKPLPNQMRNRRRGRARENEQNHGRAHEIPADPNQTTTNRMRAR